MKKARLIILFIAVFGFNIKAYAASASLYTSSRNVYVGDSFSVGVNVNGVASWEIHVSASGPVSGCTINESDVSSNALNTNKTFTASCRATNTGTITLSLSGNGTSDSEERSTKFSGSTTVNVSKRPSQPSGGGGNTSGSGSNNNSNNNTSNNNNNNNNTTPTKEVDDGKSKNNKIKEIKVDGYNLVKVDDNNYTLSVSNDISKIKINATAEDSKSTITGIGEHNLSIGENNIEIIVTSESGAQNKINIKVTRKDGFYLDDLDNLLKKENINSINIKIDENTKITKEDLKKIKNSKKNVNLDFYDSTKKIIYSFILNGSKISDKSDFIPKAIFDSNYRKEILKLSNYADGMLVKIPDENGSLKGIKLKLFVGSKYSNDDMVNIYSFDKNQKTIKQVGTGEVKDGYIVFDFDDNKDYLLTMSSISLNTNKKKKNNMLLLSSIIEFVVIIGLVLSIVLKKKLKTQAKDEVLTETKISETNAPIELSSPVQTKLPEINSNNVENHEKVEE